MGCGVGRDGEVDSTRDGKVDSDTGDGRKGDGRGFLNRRDSNEKIRVITIAGFGCYNGFIRCIHCLYEYDALRVQYQTALQSNYTMKWLSSKRCVHQPGQSYNLEDLFPQYTMSGDVSDD